MEIIKTHCLIVNHENILDFKNLIQDLFKQDVKYNLTIIDQNSKDKYLLEFYKNLEKKNFIKIIYNTQNRPLNYIWNEFYQNTLEPYLAFLNNDIRITSNFISDSEKIFEKEKEVAVTIHSTNHSSYTKKSSLEYIVLDEAWQGWDFTIRRENYSLIPTTMEWFGGDCWIFSDLVYKQNQKIGCVLSSPIIHYQGSTRRSDRGILSKKDTKEKIRLGFKNPKRKNLDYINIKPTSQFIQEWLKNNS